ncbi:rhamnan synthesis protein F [Ancylobacter aquaticus]|uniref:Rhamnan synthesis protein F n=1 Tax=Ancylobacter aquaticus TaxID=100 RepID=A0A4V6NDN3_ANCAQ|nr:rhamnan synthesis F family protein [Ancylobacter aquaticus]TCK30086.1 rhamnan synthesis protein F [Ancylobacter aquaticus]
MAFFRKIGKELGRWRSKLRSAPWMFLGAVRRRDYDSRRPHSVKITPGNQPIAEQVAILVIFPRDGIPDSTFATLAHFARNGIACVVVSNATLREGDRERLCAGTHLVIERPNLGYDFGGFREGILTLFDRGVRPRMLFLMNDSLWFPLRPDCDAVARCQQAKEDIFGFHLNCAPRFGVNHEYVQSYFLRFSQRLVASEAFLAFWRDMPLIDNKHMVVRRLERGLSRHFARRGYTLGAFVHWRTAIDRLMALDDADKLSRLLAYQCRLNPKDAAAIRPMLEQGWAPLRIRDALAGPIRRKRLFASFPMMHPEFVLDLGFPALKRKLSIQYRELVRLGLDADFEPAVRAEMQL